jgi:hypothetical protein
MHHRISRLAIFFASFAFGLSCGTTNRAEPYVALDTEQKARKALDDKDWAAAVEQYALLVEDYPETYKYRVLYATALAGAGGVELLSVVLDQLGGAGGSSSGILGLIDQIVPAEVTNEKTASVKLAVEVLQAIPDAALEEDAELKSSSQLQKTVYSSVYTAMLLDSILNIENGQITPENLANMTPEQAIQIIDAFILAGSVGDPSNPLTQAMASAGESINGASGEDAKAKLQEYLNQQQGG